MSGEILKNAEVPYVVSADVAGLFSSWAMQNGLTVPSKDFLSDLSQDLVKELATSTGHPIEVVSEEELREGLYSEMSRTPYPLISLDRAYVESSNFVSGFIDMTRGVNNDLEDIGLIPRPGYPNIDSQIEKFKSGNETIVTLVDDVIFSGDGIIELTQKLERINVRVGKIIAGIGILEGIDKVSASGIDIACVRTFNEVVDEVCERDFLAGVPLSGRTMVSNGNFWSAPYFEPFGKPNKWASIAPDAVQSFSRFCIEQSIQLWEQTGSLSGKVILPEQIPRRIELLDKERSVVFGLKKQLPLMEGVE